MKNMSIDDELLNTEDLKHPMYPKMLKTFIRRIGTKHHIKEYGGAYPANLIALRNVLQNDIDTDPDPVSIMYYLKRVIIDLIDALEDHENRLDALESG